MSYTIEEYDINGSNPSLENELLVLWAKFCMKSNPLPIFEGRKTVSQKFSLAFKYFESNFRGNKCFYIKEHEAFAVFGSGQKWLDSPVSSLTGKKTAVLIMAASLNPSPKHAWHMVYCIQECCSLLRKQGYEMVAWNINRQSKKEPFLRMIKRFGAKTTENCHVVEL